MVKEDEEGFVVDQLRFTRYGRGRSDQALAGGAPEEEDRGHRFAEAGNLIGVRL